MTISQTLKLEDRVSPVFKDIAKNAEATIRKYKELDEAQTRIAHTASLISTQYGTNNKVYKELQKALGENIKETKNFLKNGYSEESPWYEKNKFYQKWQEGQQSVTAEVSATEAALKRVGSVIKTVVGVYSIRQLMNMSDQLVQVEARLGLANKGDYSTEEFSNKIYSAAQRSRADYNTMASTIAKLGMQAGDAFGSNDELIKFAENLNKIFVTSGLDSTSISSVMYNLTQSLSTGRLLGNDYRILKMNAPEFVKMLRDSYANGSQETLDQMVSKGQVSAQMLKKAVIDGTKEIEEKFNKMPVTWEQAFTSIKNSTQKLMKPILKIVSNIAGAFYTFTSNIEKNWKQIAPIFEAALVLITAIGATLIAMKLKNIAVSVADSIALKASAANFIEEAMAAAAAGQSVDMHALAAARNAQATSAMAATLGKVVIVLGATVAAAKLTSVALEKVTGDAYDTFGLITAGIGLTVGFAIETIKPFLNFWIALINSIVGFFSDGLNGIKNAWLGVLILLLEGVETVAKEIDRVAGTNYAGNTQGGLHRQILEMKSEREMLQKDLNFKGINYLDPKGLSEWTKEGYWLGEGISKSISGAFDTSEALASVMGSDGMGGDAIKTTSNDKLLDEEDIQLLLDVATRDYKLNYQHITPEVIVTFGDVRETADVEQVLEQVVTKLEEAASGDLGMVMA